MSLKILVVDDSPTLRKFIVKHLSAYSANYQVLTAANGSEGVELAKKEKPDLILLDFILPDMNGEDVCNKLLADQETASIPIVLMSSSGPDITRTEGKFEAIKRSMVKPFSPELLCASVSYIFKSQTSPPVAESGPQTESTETPSRPLLQAASIAEGNLVFCGESDYFPLLHALIAAESKRLTGVLRVQNGALPVEIYFREGALVLATTRDVETYLSGTPLDVPPEQESLFSELKMRQQETGCPIFLQMLDRDLAPQEEALMMADQYGSYLVASAWTQSSTYLEFRRLHELPAYLAGKNAAAVNVLAWCLESLRLVGDECASYPGLTGTNGLPSYTKTGYDRIQILPLDADEVAFANHVADGRMVLDDIAAALGITPAAARHILFRFVVLEIFDYWPQTAGTS